MRNLQHAISLELKTEIEVNETPAELIDAVCRFCRSPQFDVIRRLYVFVLLIN